VLGIINSSRGDLVAVFDAICSAEFGTLMVAR
jgi:hypothetical protein